MIEAVIIDVDDTLCLTEAVCFEMENEVLERMGRSGMPRSLHVSTWGKPLFEVITERSPGINVDAFKTAYHPVIAEYITAGKLDTIPDKNYETLDALIKIGKAVMILTSRTHGEARHLLEPDHLLATRVKAFFYHDNTQYHKPDPRVFTELLQTTHLLPENCVYVGDSLGDSQAAHGAGMHFVASLESGLRERQDFNPDYVDAFITNFPELYSAILRLDQKLQPQQ